MFPKFKAPSKDADVPTNCLFQNVAFR